MLYSEYMKKKEEEEKKKAQSSNSSLYSNMNYSQYKKAQSFGFDTLESDLHTMGETLNNIYGSWQTKETMDNTFESVNKMYNRLVGYQDYHTQYGKESGLPDLSELLNTYKDAVDKWGERTELYGNYQNADAFNKAVKDYQLSEKFKGLSYDRVQGLLRKYDVGTDEYNYLKNYTGYTSTEDFDKALAGLSTDIGIYNKANEYEGRISSYEGQADKFKKRTNGLTNDGGYGKKADDTRVEYNAWLAENGFDSGNALKAEYADEVKLAKELGKAKNVYDLDNGTVDKYKYLEQNEDFAEHSQYDSSVNEGKKPHYQPFTNYDIKYDYINNVPEIRDSYERKAGNKDAGTAFSDNGWEYLTEKELAYYNYLHYLDGQNGTKKSDKFLEDLKPALQKRYSEKASERREEMLETPFMAGAFSLVSPIMTMAGGIGNLMATGKDIVTGSEYNPYDPLREISNANAHGREVVSQNIAEATEGFELFGQNIASFLYNTGESVLDTVVGGSGFGPGYTVLMGTNAYQQKAKELTEQGYDATTVQGLAITSGVLEMAFEYAGFDHLMKLKDADSIGKVIYNALASQGGAEGLEELGTSIGNMMAEYGFLGEDSQYMKKYNDLIARGFSEKEASIEVAKAMASEIAWSYAGGWLSGVGLGAGTSVGQYTQNKAVGKDLRGAEQIGDVLNIASMTPEESEAYKAYTAYANKGVTADNITDAQLGNLYNTMSGEAKGGFRTAVTDLANAHGEMTTQRTTLGYEYELAKKDMLSAKAEIDTLKGIIDSNESTEVQKASASADLDNAIAKYNEAQQRMNKTYDSAVASESLTDRQRNKAENKLDKAVSEYTDAQARMGKYAPIADKLSGVEESVGAYNAKRTIEKAEAEKRAKHEAEVKNLSSGVETSVMADTDKAIEIKGMKDSDTLITSDGEVKLKDVELSDRDADLVAYARHMEASEANLYLEQYNGEDNIEEYTNTFSLVTSMAKNNYSEDALLKAKGSLSTEQFNAIYAATVAEKYREKQRNIDKLNADMAGKMSYKGVIDDSVIDYDNKSTKGKVNWNSLDSRQREAVTFISGFAKATGMNLKFIADGERKGINGSYDKATNTITIDVYAGISKAKNLLKDTIIPTMSHETTHWMKEKSPELYRKIGDLIFKTLEAHDGISEVDRVASEVARHNAKGRNITDDGARDEIIARACEDMLKMSEEGKRLFNSLSESEKKTFIDKVKEILANLMEWVDNLLNSYSSDRYEAKVMREYKDTLAELSKMWDEMLVSSVKNNSSMELAGVFGNKNNTSDGEVQNSIREEFASEIDEWKKAGMPDGETFILGMTGDVFQGLGAIESDIYMLGDKIKEILSVHPEMAIAEIKKIPQILENPVLILKSKNVNRDNKNNTRLVVFGNVKGQDGRPILSVLDLRPVENNLVVDDMQKVSSAYTKDVNPVEFIKNSFVVYADKKRTTKLLRTIGFKMPIELQQSGYIGNISYKGQNVNIFGEKFSKVFKENISDDENMQNDDRDSDGKALTKEQIEFFKDSKVRDENGNLLVMYHGTNAEFSVFKKGTKNGWLGKGIYFSDSKKYARKNGKNIFVVYLDVKNPFLVKGNDHYALLSEAKELFPEVTEMNVAEVLKNNGYDGIVLNDWEQGTIISVFEPEQIKLTSNKNPTASDDIRYSDRDEDISVYEKLGELDRVLKERDILKADIQRLYERLKLEGKVTNGKYFTDSSILNAAGFLLKKADSKYDKVELAKRLKSLYHGMTTNTKVDSNALWNEVLEIANDIALMAKPKIVKNDYAMNLLKEIKGTRVRFNSNQKAEAKARFGANWNRNFFGKIILADDARLELDQQWQEWAEEHPDIFDAHVKDSNQPMELYDILTTLKEQSEIVEEYNKEEFVQYIATEILGATWNLKPIVTTADKYNAKIKEIRSEHKQAMKDVRDAYNARVDESRLAERMHFGAEIAKLRRQKDEKVAEAKELGKQKMADYRENIAKKTKIQSITSNVLDLNDKLVKNSKDKHIPEAMKDAVGELLRAIDFSSKRKLEGGEPTKKDIALEKALGHLKDAITDGSKEIGDILDEMYGSGIDDSIKELVKSVDKHMSSIDGQVFTLNEMTLDELNKLDSIVKIIKATANKVNKFHVAQHNAGVQALGVRSMEEIDSRKKIFKDDKKHFEKMKTSVFWNNLNPFYAFKNLGEASQKIFTALQDGQDKLAFLSKEVIDFADSVYSAKDYNKWKDTYFEFEVAQPNGKIAKFSMNVPQIMSLYCVTKQEDARTHILHGGEDGEGGGITIVETDKKEAVRTNIRLTEADLNNIISKLDGVNNVKGDKTAKGVADELQEFMCRRGADLGNEISMARWGIKSFGITNYFPIKVSEGSVPMKNDAPGVDSVSMLELLNMSFTHARNHFAKQSVEIGDVFDVFSSHMSNMARYNAMALPILDMYKWMNSRVRDEYGAEHSVQTSIKDTFGDYAWKYFGTLLKDISGGTKKSTRDKLAVRFFKNAKVAKVAANIRVVALQFTSYIRAGAVMDNKYLLKSLNYFSTRELKDETFKNSITKAKKYCGIALWKSMGYYDTDITRGLTEQIKHSTDVRSKLVELSLKGAEWADETTWGVMWNACEFEIRDKHPELKPKTEEYYKAVGERLRDVIYRTQVVDSMLTRSQMMRSPDAWDKVLTMFGSESTLSLNLAMDVFTSYELDKRSLGKEKAKAKNKKYIRKAITAYIVTNVVTSALQTLFDAFRDYDEDEKDEEYLTKLMLENFLSNSSIINKIPYLNAFSSIISGFTPSRTDVDWMNDSVKAVKAIYKCFAEGKSVEPAIKYTLKTLSDASGIAGYNLYRDIYALYELFNGD